MDSIKFLILLNGEDKTESITSIKEQDNLWHITFANTAKTIPTNTTKSSFLQIRKSTQSQRSLVFIMLNLPLFLKSIAKYFLTMGQQNC
ncbi:hypothetical protein ACLI44_000743 [Campylobacter upsaliensis]